MNTLEARSVEGPFASAQISHADIADFAVECVNLNREDAQEYREQVRQAPRQAGQIRGRPSRLRSDQDLAFRKPRKGHGAEGAQ